MEFFDWNNLSGFAGSVLAVAVLTQITKGAPVISRMPTQLWSYLLSLATLLLAQVFGSEGMEAGGAVLAFFNAALVSLTANGGYAAVNRIKEGLSAQSMA